MEPRFCLIIVTIKAISLANVVFKKKNTKWIIGACSFISWQILCSTLFKMKLSQFCNGKHHQHIALYSSRM